MNGHGTYFLQAAQGSRLPDENALFAEVQALRLLLINTIGAAVAWGEDDAGTVQRNASVRESQQAQSSRRPDRQLCRRDHRTAMTDTQWGRKETIVRPPHYPVYSFGAIFVASRRRRSLRLSPSYFRDESATTLLSLLLCRNELPRHDAPEQRVSACDGRRPSGITSGLLPRPMCSQVPRHSRSASRFLSHSPRLLAPQGLFFCIGERRSVT